MIAFRDTDINDREEAEEGEAPRPSKTNEKVVYWSGAMNINYITRQLTSYFYTLLTALKMSHFYIECVKLPISNY